LLRLPSLAASTFLHTILRRLVKDRASKEWKKLLSLDLISFSVYPLEVLHCVLHICFSNIIQKSSALS
jgi:hypothetical protein